MTNQTAFPALPDGEPPNAGRDPEIRPDGTNRSGGSTTAQVVMGARVIIASQIFTLASRFGTSIALAAMLHPQAIGIVAVAQTLTMFFDQVRDLGMGQVIVQRPQLRRSFISTLFVMNVGVGVALAAVQAGLAVPIGAFMHEPDVASVLLALSPVLIVSGSSQVHHALLRRDLRYGEVAIINAAGALANTAASLLAAVAGMGFWSIVIGIGAGVVVDAMLCWHYDKWRPSRQLEMDWRAVWEVAPFSSSLLVGNLLAYILGQADRVFVGRWRSPAALGLYSMAARILSYPQVAVSSLVAEVSVPAFAKHQKDNAALRIGLIRSTRVIALITFPMMAGAAAVARPAVDGVLGPTWHDLTPLLWILAPLGALQSISGLPGTLLIARGASRRLFLLMVLSTAPGLIAFVIGLHWGLVWACAGSAIGYAATTPTFLPLALHEVGLSLVDFFREVASVAMISGAMAGAVFAATLPLTLGPLAKLFIGTVVGIAVYSGLLALFRPAALEDAREALRARRGRQSKDVVGDVAAA